jgi:hypothetical protein
VRGIRLVNEHILGVTMAAPAASDAQAKLLQQVKQLLAAVKSGAPAAQAAAR